jgi:hypothetical protein
MKKIPEAAQSDQLTILDSEPGKFAIYGWQNITIVVWPNQATGPTVLRFAKVIQSVVEAHPEGISNVQIILDGAGVPTSEARAGFIDLMKQYAKQVACVAVVLLGGGFWASAIRAAVTGISMIAPHTFPLRMHGSMAEVAKWLPVEHLKRTGVHLDPQKLTSVLNNVKLQQTSSSPTEKK